MELGNLPILFFFSFFFRNAKNYSQQNSLPRPGALTLSPRSATLVEEWHPPRLVSSQYNWLFASTEGIVARKKRYVALNQTCHGRGRG